MLITPEYRRLNAELHENSQDYGTGVGAEALVDELRKTFTFTSLLDYGCGKGALGRALEDSGLTVTEYDPAIPTKDTMPLPAECVACVDVLEHIEPDCLDAVLDHIFSLARVCVLLVVDNRLAMKTLADGRNAHLIVESPEWWARKLAPYMDFTKAETFDGKPDKLVSVFFGAPKLDKKHSAE